MKLGFSQMASNRAWRWDELGDSRTGRVILHTVCIMRHPGRLVWHWRGILREFAH